MPLDPLTLAALLVTALLAAALGGTTAQWLGYGPNFLLGGAVSLAAVGLAWLGTSRPAASPSSAASPS